MTLFSGLLFTAVGMQGAYMAAVRAVKGRPLYIVRRSRAGRLTRGDHANPELPDPELSDQELTAGPAYLAADAAVSSNQERGRQPRLEPPANAAARCRRGCATSRFAACVLSWACRRRTFHRATQRQAGFVLETSKLHQGAWRFMPQSSHWTFRKTRKTSR